MNTDKMPDIMNADEFREVLVMEPDAQRALLRSDDPRYRVWAAWALGLRLADEFTDTARHLLADEPVAGVRRHLVVMVAGYGEVDIVAALARHDPDEYVRATAARYVAELSTEHPDVREVLEHCLQDDSPQVRAATLERLPLQAPDRLWALVEQAAHDDDIELRRAATRRLMSLDRVPNVLVDRLFAEEMDTIRLPILQSLVRRVGVERVYEEAVERERVSSLVNDLITAEITLTWEDLERLKDPALLRAAETSSFPAAGRTWLLRLPDSHRLPALSRVERAYEDVTRVDDAAERAALTDFLDRLDKHLQQEPDDSDDDGELVEWGTLFPTETPGFRLLTRLRELL